jgi:D-amino peptidase
MNVFVLVDMEGIAGVVNSEELHAGSAEYDRARRWMTAEANAVVTGILDVAADAIVTVADAHNQYRNLLPDEVDTRAWLLRGKPALMGMVDGLDDTYDMALLVGMHTKAGTGHSLLSHTFTDALADVRLNGHSYGEIGLNAAVAGAHGVPIVLVSGDGGVAAEARSVLGEAVATVVVKESRGAARAATRLPSKACELLREAAAQVIRQRPAVPPLRIATPVTVEVRFAFPWYADLAELVEGIERVDGCTIHATRSDMLAAYRLLRLLAVLCSVRG